MEATAIVTGGTGGLGRAVVARWVKPEAIAEVISNLLSRASGPVSGGAIPAYGRA
jgi:NAD(P)-dependent dehydrogenase (short-subunit alcohol dehydrogenase family)